MKIRIRRFKLGKSRIAFATGTNADRLWDLMGLLGRKDTGIKVSVKYMKAVKKLLELSKQ